MRRIATAVCVIAMLVAAQNAFANSFADDQVYSFSLQTSEETVETTEVTESSPDTILWDGFLWGDRHFKDFPRPVGMPMYFEDPFINTDLRLIYVWHGIPGGSELRGGEVQVFAAQIRIALTERLALIATKDGYSKVHTGITPDADGWNDFGLGLKYAFYVDKANDFIVSGGFRWEWDNGHSFALQGNSQEISPFISFAKGWDKFHMIGALSYRIPTDSGDGCQSLVWNLHFDYEVIENFFPLVEFHGIHWLSDGDRLPTTVDGLDVTSLGSAHVAGRDFFSCGLGFRWQMTEWASLGATYEIPLESPNENIQSGRATINMILSL